MRHAILAGALVAALVLAGCSAPPGPEPTAPTPWTPPPHEGPRPAFDGAAAHAFVAALVHLDDGSLRPRVSADPASLATADWLLGLMDLPGWDARTQEFTGEDYQGHDHGAVSHFVDPGHPDCREDDWDLLPGIVFQNVVATHRVEPPTDLTLLLAAHWDQKKRAEVDGVDTDDPVPGANDGASGVGVLLQLMRHVTAGQLRPPVNLIVAFFDGEDGFEDCHPLAGSIHFARTMEDGVVGRMLLLDMVGDPDARFIRERLGEQSDPMLQGLLWHHGKKRLGPEVFTDQRRPILDDHVPFIEEGVGSVNLIDAGRPPGEGRHGFPLYWHTPEDTMDHIDAGMLGAVGDIVWDLLEDGNLVATWPGR